MSLKHRLSKRAFLIARAGKSHTVKLLSQRTVKEKKLHLHIVSILFILFSNC